MALWKWSRSIARRAKYLGQRARFDADLDAEVQFHLESRAEELRQNGLSHDEALARARREFGPRVVMCEESRGAWQYAWLEQTAMHLRYALRQCRKRPGFSLVVVLTLGLGIGANSAVFSLIDAVLLRPLPFPEGDRLMRIYQRNPRNPITQTSPARLADWDRLNTAFQSVTGFYTEDVSETSGDLPEKITRALVAPRFFEAWGIGPALGRDFTPQEERVGGVAIISDRLWRRQFGADPNAIGRTLRFGERSATVVGVMPASFLFPVRAVDVWNPVVVPPAVAPALRNATWYTALGRLKPGVSLAQAKANLTGVQRQLAREYPQSDAALSIDVQPLVDEVVGSLRSSLWLVFGSASLLLLIACVNVAALLLVRATERRHEIAIRTSLGASRRSVIAQLMAETAVLAALGGVVGLSIASASAQVFHTMAAGVPRIDELRLDWRIVLYSMVSALGVTLLCGLLPAMRSTRRDVSSGLAHEGRTQVSGRQRLQWLLVATQVSLAVVLLAGAGVLLRSFQQLARVTPGFESSHILTFHISGSYQEFSNFAGVQQRIETTLDFLRAVPGVQQAATASFTLPGVPSEFPAMVRPEGRAESEGQVVAENRTVSASYFDTMRIPLIAGEACRPAAPPANPSVMVNRSFANTYFSGSSPIGHRLLPAVAGGPAPPVTILGVVGDARETGLHRAPGPTVYFCASAQSPTPFFLVRTSGEPGALAETVRRRLKEIEPTRSVFDIVSLDDRLGDAYNENRLRIVALAAFAVTAVSLACIGLYGTLSYMVNIRRREIGLRLALGAGRGQILRRFLGQGVAISLVACAAGLALSIASNRALASMLYGVSSADPTTLSAVALIVLAAAALASLIPSVRGALVQPMHVLRDE